MNLTYWKFKLKILLRRLGIWVKELFSKEELQVIQPTVKATPKEPIANQIKNAYLRYRKKMRKDGKTPARFNAWATGKGHPLRSSHFGTFSPIKPLYFNGKRYKIMGNVSPSAKGR